MRMQVDPLTRAIHVTYAVPATAPDAVKVQCAWSFHGEESWHPAAVHPLLTETGLRLASSEDIASWARGELVERRAAGLDRVVVFNPYPEAQKDGQVDVDFRVILSDESGAPLSTGTLRLQADNLDVKGIEDWVGVFQKEAVAEASQAKPGQWSLAARSGPGNILQGSSGNPLPQISYPLDLKGWHAIFVKDGSGILLRLSGDERADPMSPGFAGQEVLWKWAKMDRQNLVIKQAHTYTGWGSASLTSVRFVPLTEEQVQSLEASFGKPDRTVVGYWEPYSWAFHDDVEEPLQHRACLTAFSEARVSIADTQIGRFGMKVVYESRLTDPLLYETIGDPIGTIAQPRTNNVGRMQQYTNTLDATLRYAKELGLRAHANFGASNCYVGTPLQGDFSKVHPDWLRGHALRFEVPEVRAYALSLYREALDIGAPGISIDFCRYPETIDKIETCNTFLKELRGLADEFEKKRGERISVLVRFPGTGVKRSEFFDCKTWAQEGWVDMLCPSNIQGRHLNIPVKPYLDAVKETTCQLLPSVDALEWGLSMPGPFLWRVEQLYQSGVPGVHVYQADGRVLGRPEDRRCIRLLASREGVSKWWEEDRHMRPQCSKGIFITRPNEVGGTHGWERCRIWVEGISFGPMEVYLDNRLVNKMEGPPYLVGTEDYESDRVISPGEHELKIKVKDNDGWLEQTFKVTGAK